MANKIPVKKRITYQTIPLSNGFMITSMLGLLVVTVYTVYERLSVTWGVALGLIFFIMFIASIVSITPSFPSELIKKKVKG